jgi:predicted PurR-regulated permease PerM
MPDGHKSIYDKVLHDFEHSIGLWVKGQFILMLVIGSLSTLVLYILGNPYYLPLGILAGLLEVVPIVGPLISTLFAVLISYSLNGQTAGLVTLASFYGIQVLENNLIVPKVMEKVSGFSPILILLAFLIFTNFLGLVGAILAVPILMFANILVKYFVIKK